MTDSKRLDFLRSRQSGIGGSDIPRILQLVPNTNALDTYHAKTRPIRPDDPVSVDLLRGHELEEMARAHYWAKTGRKGRDIKKPTTHPDYPAWLCHLDFEIFADPEREEGLRGTGVGETKCPRAFIMRKVVDHGIRESELVQGLAYCAVARREWCGFNLFSLEWDDGNGLPTLPIDVVADPVLGDQLLKLGQKFMDEHVTPRIPPDPADWKPIGQKLVEEVRESTGELYKLVQEEAIEMSYEIAAATRLVKRTERALKEAKERMLLWIEAHSPSDKVIAPSGHKHTIVRLKGKRTLQRESLALHRPIDRDKLRAFLTSHPMFVKRESDDVIDEMLDEWELDLDRFMRTGEPSKHIRFTEGKT